MEVKFTERGVRLELENGTWVYVYHDVVFVQPRGNEFPYFLAAREPEREEVAASAH
jgi:hypothetical protein